MTLRIAYVINSLEGGGAALPIPKLARVMADWGADVRIFALSRRDGRAEATILAVGLTCTICDCPESDNLRAFWWLKREMQGWRPSIIWTSLTRATLIGLLLGRYLRIPVISWQHNAFLKPGNERWLRWLQPLGRLWVADSPMVAALTATRLRVPPDRLMVWPLFSTDPDAPVAAPWQPGQTLRIGSLGRLHNAKGYDVLIAALAQLNARGFVSPVPFEVLIAGDGALLAELRDAARSAGVTTIRWTGYADDPKAFLASLHAYVQPSRREGFCIAAHEAMHAGLPVIASAVGELQTSITDGVDGSLVPPGDPSRLADALAHLLTHAPALHAMGQTARQQVDARYSPAQFAAAGRAILDRLAKTTR